MLSFQWLQTFRECLGTNACHHWFPLLTDMRTRKPSCRWQTHATQSMPKMLKFDVLTTLSLTILVYLHSFTCCCVRNLRNPEKFSENSNLEFKVIQGHRSWCQSKAHIYTLLLVTNSNFGRISYRFRDIDTFSSKIAFSHPAPFTGERHEISTQSIHRWKAHGLQFRCWHYRSIFIRLAVVASQNREISGNSDKIWPYRQQFKVIQGHRSWCQSKAHMRLSISH